MGTAQLLEKLNNLQKEDYEWLAEEVAPLGAGPQTDLKVRLDAFFSPSYVQAYAAAWHALLPRAVELAIPILYLQRHTLELLLKDAIRSLLAIRNRMDAGHDVFGLPPSPLSPAEVIKVKGHEYGPLFEGLEKSLQAFSLPGLPDDFYQVRKLLEVIERNDETRLRYETLKVNEAASFEFDAAAPIFAEIGAISAHLMNIVSSHWKLSDTWFDVPTSLMDHIAQKSQLANDSIVTALDDLQKRTRTDQVTWARTQTPAVKNTKSGMIRPTCVTANYNGRRLVLVTLTLPDGNAASVLGCNVNGKVNRLLWPPWYQIDVAAAVREVMKTGETDLPP